MSNLTKFILVGMFLMPLALFGQSLGDNSILDNYFNSSTADFLSRINPSISFENNYNHRFSEGNPVLYVLDSINTDGAVESYDYDELGRVVSAIVFDNGVVFQDETFTYLGETAQVDVTNINAYTNGILSNEIENQFNYDDNQVLESISLTSIEVATGDRIVNSIVFDFDAEGILSSYSVFGLDDYKNRVLIIEFVYSFDEQGRLTSELANAFVYGMPILVQAIDVFYDSIPNTVLVEIDQPAQGTGFSSQIVLTYNEGIDVEELIYPSMSDPFPRLTDAFELDGQLAFLESNAFDLNGNITGSSETSYFWAQQDFDTSVDDFSTQNIEVFPNPVNDILNFQIGDQVSGLSFEIYNLMGQQQLVEGGVLGQDQKIDVSLLSSGMYFFTLQDEKQVLYTGKFIKE